MKYQEADTRMARITRTRLLIGAAALALVTGVAFQGARQGDAATYVGLTMLSADPVLTSTSTGVTSTTPFPGGGTTAKCFINISWDGTDHNTPVYTPYGDCTGDSITNVDTSYITDANAAVQAGVTTAGSAFSMNGTAYWTYAYDAGDAAAFSATAVGSFIHPTLEVSITNNAGEQAVLYANDDTQAARSGCFNYVDTGGEATPQCFAIAAAGPGGAWYSVQTQAGSGTFAETKCVAADYATCTGTVGADGNVPVTGVFFLAAQATGPTNTPAATDTPVATETPGGPTDTPTVVAPTATATTPVLAASYVRVNRAHGLTKIHWVSTAKVRGFNVFDKHAKINKHLVTSKSANYHFTTHHVFKQLRLKPVQ